MWSYPRGDSSHDHMGLSAISELNSSNNIYSEPEGEPTNELSSHWSSNGTYLYLLQQIVQLTKERIY